jgi:putative SOS response-associated peptidase YedK
LAVITDQVTNRLQYFRWGLIPFWAKEIPKRVPLINARAESITEKPAFRQVFRSKRCLVPADGFYEWVHQGKKVPWHFTLVDGAPFAMAGLWDVWKNHDNQEIGSFTIITTSANELMAPIHDRMPVILDREGSLKWLENTDSVVLQNLLKPFPAEKMKACRVSDKVNSVKNEGPFETMDNLLELW